MENMKVRRGNTGPIINVTAGPASELLTGWTCRITVALDYGQTPIVDSVFAAPNGIAKVWLTHEETLTLVEEEYLIAVQMINDDTTPPYRIEDVGTLTVLGQIAVEP
ncbi:MAG: hypothetical protein DRI46_06780 [Chloroflexi bacterium]|nr:MAG: hypothetical protein DRI46_06780 [Chloroflexota bacterium]